MKIDKVILSSNDSKTYLDFWPIVSKAWKNIDIEPILIYTGKKKFPYCKDGVFHFNYKKINSAFVAQNIRLLAPSLFPDDICIISDIDNMPLSKSYFQDNICGVKHENFVIYRPKAATDDMISIMWNAALGKTWSEIFEIKNEKNIEERLIDWYPNKYKVGGNNWYFDQKILKIHIENFESKFPSRITRLDDGNTNFLRLNRSKLGNNFEEFYNPDLKYSDFHMPRPYKKYKNLIDTVYNSNF